jgi:hypothetical protein
MACPEARVGEGWESRAHRLFDPVGRTAISDERKPQRPDTRSPKEVSGRRWPCGPLRGSPGSCHPGAHDFHKT